MQENFYSQFQPEFYREPPRQPSIRIHNDPTRIQVDSNRRNPSRSSLFVSADGNLLPGREGEGLHGMVHGPFQGFHGLIDTILSENLTLRRGCY